MQSHLLIAGLINIETTLAVKTFPIAYEPVQYPFFGIQSSVAGVGLNISKAMTTLGDQVSLLSLVGSDMAGSTTRHTLQTLNITDQYVLTLPDAPHTAQAIILYNPNGERMIYTDLKNMQEVTYPPAIWEEAVRQCDAAILCNINFSRPMLQWAKQLGKLVITDVHAIRDLDDAYNRDYMAAADILFMSDAKLPMPPEQWAQAIQTRYSTPIIVIGMGAHGALLAVRQDHYIDVYPAVTTRPVINTIGAGDALLSAFVHFYLSSFDPYHALRKAIIFASYKVGAVGAADGFLTEAEVAQLITNGL